MVQRKREEMIDSELLASLIPKDAVEQKTGFPPYWVPEIGSKFFATVINKDARSEQDDDDVREDPNEPNSNFDRYEFIALEDVLCKQGPARNQVDVLVPAGERFTCSAYGSLNLDLYIGFDITIIVVGTQKMPGNKRSRGAERDMWLFKVFTDETTDKKLKELRLLEAKQQREFIRAKRLEGVNKSLNGGKTPVLEGEKVDRIPF